MSGGVDSSVAAALLVEGGYEVIGVMMRLWAEGHRATVTRGREQSEAQRENRCCTPQAVDDARRVAARLGIPFYLVNYEAAFKRCVVDYFIAEYSRGRTPNPCLACNRHIRFGRLLRHAQTLDAELLATGHYAQSYVLYMLGQDDLRRVLLPIGSHTKAQVREMARERHLTVADKEESMELCFVADDDYRRFLREHAPQAVRPGPILDTAGREIGRHQGLPLYTVGQRKGLGIAAPEALYVISLDTARNALIAGPARELGRQALVAKQIRYVSGGPPPGPLRVQAKIRYKAALADATWTPLENQRARVEFDAPLRDITPGQAVVAYQGDIVLGGGIIDG
jgi:tRNA-specific 2-thiouridylase